MSTDGPRSWPLPWRTGRTTGRIARFPPLLEHSSALELVIPLDHGRARRAWRHVEHHHPAAPDLGQRRLPCTDELLRGRTLEGGAGTGRTSDCQCLERGVTQRYRERQVAGTE